MEKLKEENTNIGQSGADRNELIGQNVNVFGECFCVKRIVEENTEVSLTEWSCDHQKLLEVCWLLKVDCANVCSWWYVY